MPAVHVLLANGADAAATDLTGAAPRDLVERFAGAGPSAQPRLAEAVLRIQRRPAEALWILSGVPVDSLDARQQKFYQRLAAHAHRLQAEGVVQLGRE